MSGHTVNEQRATRGVNRARVLAGSGTRPPDQVLVTRRQASETLLVRAVWGERVFACEADEERIEDDVAAAGRVGLGALLWAAAG